MSLFDLFFGRNIQSLWSAHQVYEQFSKAEKSGLFPAKSAYPSKIHLQSRFWDECRDLHSMTLKDEHERAIDFWVVDGDICATPQIRGERGSVTSGYSLQVKYVPEFNDYATKYVYADGQEILKKSLYISQIPETSEVSHLFNLHSHPPHYLESQKEPIYSFFSTTDIKSLFATNAVALGMVSDKVTLLCKTSLSPKTLPLNISDSHISPEYLREELHIVMYTGHWSKGELYQIIED